MELQDTSFGALYGHAHLRLRKPKTYLEEWYDRVYDLPFNQFSIEDLARSLRQHLFPEHIVPRVLRVLREQPMAGVLYQGELLDSLTFLPLDFWKHNSQCRNDLIEIFINWESFMADDLDNDDLQRLQNFVFTMEVMARSDR